MSDQVKVDYNKSKGMFAITTPFMMNGIAKSLPSRRWNKTLKVWLAHPVRANAEYIKMNIATMNNVTITQEASDAVVRILTRAYNLETETMPEWYIPKMPPRAYQAKCGDQFYGRDFGGLFMCCGSGKTKTVIDIISARYMAANNIETVVVACPFSIRDNWLKELGKHCPVEYTATVLNQQTKAGRDNLHEVRAAVGTLRVLIVGIESLSTGGAAQYVEDFIDLGRCAFVLDEMSKIKNYMSKRTRAITRLGRKAKLRLGLTGTAVTQGIHDLYSQLDFLSPDIIGYGDYYSFRNRYLVMGGYNDKQIIGYSNVQELMTAIKPHVFQITLDEAMPELPSRTYTTRKVKLTTEQKATYKVIEKEKVVRVGDAEMTVQNALEQMLRLQQVTGGFVPVQHTDALTGDVVTSMQEITSAKFDEVVAVAEENSTANIIVWARFRAEIHGVAERLRAKFGTDSVVEFHGGIEPDQRWKNIELFETKQARFFVGNQATGGIGIDLVAASIVVYYSNSFSLEDRVQSEARNFRIGQKNAVTYIDLVCEGTVDDQVAEALTNKEDVADYVRRALA